MAHQDTVRSHKDEGSRFFVSRTTLGQAAATTATDGDDDDDGDGASFDGQAEARPLYVLTSAFNSLCYNASSAAENGIGHKAVELQINLADYFDGVGDAAGSSDRLSRPLRIQQVNPS